MYKLSRGVSGTQPGKDTNGYLYQCQHQNRVCTAYGHHTLVVFHDKICKRGPYVTGTGLGSVLCFAVADCLGGGSCKSFDWMIRSLHTCNLLKDEAALVSERSKCCGENHLSHERLQSGETWSWGSVSMNVHVHLCANGI